METLAYSLIYQADIVVKKVNEEGVLSISLFKVRIAACSNSATDRLMIVIYKLMSRKEGFLCENVSSTNGCIDPTVCMPTQDNPSLNNASIL